MLDFSKIKDKIIIICGPTASGKSALALDIAKEIDGVIINSDAMQVYKELPILTAQPSAREQKAYHHRLYSIIEIDHHYSVAIWLDLVKKEIEDCKAAKKTPIIVGGSGLYIKSLVDGLAFVPSISEDTKVKIAQLIESYEPIDMHNLLVSYDPELGNRLATSDIKRIARGLAVYLETSIPLSVWQQSTKPYLKRDQFFIVNIDIERDLLYKKCDSRFLQIWEMGVIEEVEKLIESKQKISYPKILGLNEIMGFIKGDINKVDAIRLAQQFTRNYAKRQVTWFKNQINHDFIIKKGIIGE